MNDAGRKEMRRAAETGSPISSEIAMEILLSGPGEIPEIMACATLMRRKYFGDELRLCSIMNAKSGACSEAFAGFAFHHNFPMMRLDGFADEEEFEAHLFIAGPAGLKGVEYFVPGAFVEARAVVAHGEADVRTGPEPAR